MAANSVQYAIQVKMGVRDRLTTWAPYLKLPSCRRVWEEENSNVKFQILETPVGLPSALFHILLSHLTFTGRLGPIHRSIKRLDNNSIFGIKGEIQDLSVNQHSYTAYHQRPIQSQKIQRCSTAFRKCKALSALHEPLSANLCSSFPWLRCSCQPD